MEKHICVFAASSQRLERQYYEFAYALGEALADAGCTLVFGAGRLGLMGACADGLLSRGGKAIGVIPQLLNQPGIPHPDCVELIETPTMHLRKQRMEDLAEAFITLPGGFGTLEELLEVITLKQLGYHQKPIIICNSGGFFDSLLTQFEQAITQGFATERARGLYCVAHTPQEAVALAQSNTQATGSVADKYEVESK